MLYSSGSRSVNLTYLILEALRMSPASIPYYVSQFLTESFPGKAIVEGDSYYFDLRKFSEEGLCTTEVISTVSLPPGYAASDQTTTVHNHVMTLWDAKKQDFRYEQKNFCFEVTWQEHTLVVLQLSWPQGYFDDCRYYWILADTLDTAKDFFATVCRWNSQIREEVLVFEGGFWQKNRDLYASIQNATLDNLVLAGTLKEDIYEDAQRFFESRTMYAEYNVPWKRGLLFIGPPGNGKTHMVKSLVNSLGYPCLYIKSFKTRQSTDTDNMRLAFNRVREAAPCIVVIEDLDALVDDENRSFFLNELDGFALNDGVLMIASTNHPERLDIAILERPSRFDRKYHFDAPNEADRVAYLKLWNQKLKTAMQLSIADIEKIAANSNNFSYAYLKELLLSASMVWVQQRTPGTMASIMDKQLEKLKVQMESESSEAKATDKEAPSELNGATTAQTETEENKKN
ncbi:AAA family ATPase [Leptothoe kymatousa]|uniref:ATP-binding protein n=1 Tax=Leptothoe kymatousa TAU-MAC 1615 TaxID=2364775 RepID=A0ABS5Y3B6_9CYAN|nr:ATP-binding protein [Leptothoe kymatousa]MBT9312296.1 ATP-binding protein [Leptothoe kymatousa TAU-MAC 1615]